MTASCLDPDPTRLDIRTSPSPRGCTVSVRGDVDATTAPALRARLLEVLRGDVDVDLDLRDVTFLDSAGLTALVVAHQEASSTGRALRMHCGRSRAVVRPLEITGLTTVFTIVHATQPLADE